MKITPTGSWVLVRPAPVSHKSVGGIDLPDTATEGTHLGDILEIGPDVRDLKKGAHVVYLPYATVSIKLAQVDYDVVKEEHVILVLS
jgi:co-chaperonin GroES (HSP10)